MIYKNKTKLFLLIDNRIKYCYNKLQIKLRSNMILIIMILLNLQVFITLSQIKTLVVLILNLQKDIQIHFTNKFLLKNKIKILKYLSFSKLMIKIT